MVEQKYPCVSNVVTPLNSVPDVKSLVVPGFIEETAVSPLTVIVLPASVI